MAKRKNAEIVHLDERRTKQPARKRKALEPHITMVWEYYPYSALSESELRYWNELWDYLLFTPTPAELAHKQAA